MIARIFGAIFGRRPTPAATPVYVVSYGKTGYIIGGAHRENCGSIAATVQVLRREIARHDGQAEVIIGAHQELQILHSLLKHSGAKLTRAALEVQS